MKHLKIYLLPAILLVLFFYLVPLPSVDETGNTPELYVSRNLEAGTKLEMDDGTLFEVHPDDAEIASVWVTPAPIAVEPSDDDDYPISLYNTFSGDRIRVRLLPPLTQR